jgi:hypothetical protein
MAEPTLQFGADAKLYYDSNSPSPNWSSPTWVEVSGVSDDGVQIDLTWDFTDTSRRGPQGRVKNQNKTRIQPVKISWKMKEILNDSAFLFLRTAAMDPTGIYQLLVCSTAYGTSGSPYVRLDTQITCKVTQALDGANTWEFEATNCASVNLVTTGLTPIGTGGLG